MLLFITMKVELVIFLGRRKFEKTDLVQTSCSTMVVKIHGSNGSSSEHVEKSYSDNYKETSIVENGIAGFIFMCS